MQKFKSVEELVNQLKPEKPVYCIRKSSIESAVKVFKKNFSGTVLYAVKTNPHPEVIKTIIDSGIDQFDVASIEEIKSIRNFSHTAKCSYMHTVKSRESIQEAYFVHGIKSFSLYGMIQYEGMMIKDALPLVWSPEVDSPILASIISFYFGSRMFRK